MVLQLLLCTTQGVMVIVICLKCKLELFAGQGLSLAVEDAVVLAWHLKQQGLGESALRRYHIHAELPSFGTFCACVPHRLNSL